MNQRILIVDDEKQMRHLLTTCLKPYNYTIEEAQTGDEALNKIANNYFDLIILDIMMPTIDGFEVLVKVRSTINKEVPIVLLTALGDTDRVVKGLQYGADDYIVKPFEPRELVARIESILRRTKKQVEKSNLIEIHGLQLEPEKLRLQYNQQIIPLTKKEYKIFFRLATRPGHVYSREQLVELEWDDFFEGDARTIDTHIKNIREKLKAGGFVEPIIDTIWGIGYKMIEDLNE